MNNINDQKILGLILLVLTAGYAAFDTFSSGLTKIRILDCMAMFMSLGVLFCYWPGIKKVCWDFVMSLSIAHLLKRESLLLMGIGMSWFSVFATRLYFYAVRETTGASAYSTGDAPFIFLLALGAILYIAAPGYDGERISTRSWLIMVGAMAATAISSIATWLIGV